MFIVECGQEFVGCSCCVGAVFSASVSSAHAATVSRSGRLLNGGWG